MFVFKGDNLSRRQKPTIIGRDRFPEGTGHTSDGQGRFGDAFAGAGVFRFKRNANLDENGFHFRDKAFNSPVGCLSHFQMSSKSCEADRLR